MIKYILFLLLTQSFLFSAVWSLTEISIATAGITPVVSSGMNVVISKQESINMQYDKVLQETNTTNRYIINNSILDKEILSELMKMNFILKQKLEIYSNSTVNNNIVLPISQDINISNTQEKNYNETNSQNSSGSYSFGCACAGALSSAFHKIDTHLFTNNLNPLNDKLENLKPIIHDSIAQIKNNKANLQKEIDRLKLLVLKTQGYIFELQKETGIASTPEEEDAK